MPLYWPIRVLMVSFFPSDVMPLFTLISGYLFSYLLAQGKYGEKDNFVINKLRRLLIPFFILGTLVNITSYDRYIADIPWGEGSHLWYCAMLFWCFVISWPVFRYASNKTTSILLLLLGLIQLAFGSNWTMGFRLPLGIHNSIFFLGYFVAGHLLFRNVFIINLIKKNFTLSVIVYFMMCGIVLLGIAGVSRFFNILHNYLYSILLLALFNGKSLNSSGVGPFIKSVCKCSFGIYVFHEWISWNFCHIPIVTGFIRNHFVWFPFLNLLWIFAVSYLITWLLLKTKIGRFLLL